MKKLTLLVGILFSFQAFGAVLFDEDFNTDLSAWTGKTSLGGAHSGFLTNDPFRLGDSLLFEGTTAAGDMFTTAGFASASGNYVLSYDYLGLCSNNDCGGYIGYSYGVPDFPSDHVWLGGTGTASGAMDVNEDIFAWVHVEIPFTSTMALPIHIMVEDFQDAGNSDSGDAYFDNIRLESVDVAEPATLGLLGLGLAIAGFGARRKIR